MLDVKYLRLILFPNDHHSLFKNENESHFVEVEKKNLCTNEWFECSAIGTVIWFQVQKDALSSFACRSTFITYIQLSTMLIHDKNIMFQASEIFEGFSSFLVDLGTASLFRYSIRQATHKYFRSLVRNVQKPFILLCFGMSDEQWAANFSSFILYKL